MQEDAEKLFQEKRKELIAPQILNRALHHFQHALTNIAKSRPQNNTF